MGRKRMKPNPSTEEEGKRREEKNVPPHPLPPTATSEEGEFRRNWSELPELALHSIFRRLVSIPDLLSFSSVCRSWNSLSSSSSTSTDLSTSFPPLLLLPVLQNPNPSFSPLRAHRRMIWSHPPRCLLQTLETLGHRSFQPKIPSRTLALPFLGYSNGHLIFDLSSSNNCLLLANIFSGQTTRIPSPSPPFSPFRHIALLTDTDLLLASDSLILSYHRATASWSNLNHGAASLAVSSRDNSNHLFSIDRFAANLRVIQFAPAASSDATPGAIRSKQMQVRPPLLFGPFILCNEFAHRLVDRGGDLLLLRFVLQFLPPVRWRIDVFKLDPEGSTWVEVESLGNWCLFVDTVGSCATACPEPGRWGGRSNCVYVTGPGCDGWVLVPVDGDRLFTICEPQATMTTRWPSPVWAYPSNMANQQSNLTSSQVGPQVKNNPRKQVRWTENMDQVLINGLLEIVLAGPKRTEKGFKAEEFTKVIDKVREACHVSVSVDNVRGRLRTLKKECDDITELFKTSGFGLDSSGRVSADPITWETYIKEKPEGAKMKGKLCPRYYDLLTVFGNDAATGDRAVSGNDFPPMSELVDDLEGENDVEETQPSHSTNSHRSVQGGPSQRRKRTKPMEDVALALAKIANSSEMIAVAFDKQASQNYVNGQALLEKLKEMNIDQGDILDLMQVFEGDEKAGKFFLEITDLEFRRLWVYRKLGRDPPL